MTKQTQRSLDAAIKDLGTPAERETGESYNRIGAVMDFIKTYAGGYAGRQVLDIGSSIGVHALAAIQEGGHVTGVDKFVFPEIPSNAFQLTRQVFDQVASVWSSRGLTMMFHDVDSVLPFASNSFDLVVSNAVIEHLHGSHKTVFSEAYRVLKPGGSFVVTTPNLVCLLKRIRFLIGRSPNWDIQDFFNAEGRFIGHTREFTVDECRQMATWSGFTVVKAQAMPTYIRWEWLMQPKKYAWILSYVLSYASPFFGDNVFLAARKP